MKNQKGFALLEMVIAIALMTAFGGIVMVGYPHFVHVKNHKGTEETLREVKEAFSSYYDKFGELPSSLDSVAPYVPTSAPVLDSWRKPMQLFKNVEIESPSGSVTQYNAVVVSGGKNGAIDSAIDDSTGYLVIGSTDLALCMSFNKKNIDKASDASREMQIIKEAALSYYDVTGTTPASLEEFTAYTSLINKSASGIPIDPWSSEYVGIYSSSATGGFFQVLSKGADKIQGTADDISLFVSSSELAQTGREKTKSKLVSANTTKALYESTWGVIVCPSQPTTCIEDLLSDPNGNSVLPISNAYDVWGTKLKFDTVTSSFISAGPDADFASATDNVIL